MPDKLTMEDVDKRLEEIRNRRIRGTQGNGIETMLEVARLRSPQVARKRLPRLPRIS